MIKVQPKFNGGRGGAILAIEQTTGWLGVGGVEEVVEESEFIEAHECRRVALELLLAGLVPVKIIAQIKSLIEKG